MMYIASTVFLLLALTAQKDVEVDEDVDLGGLLDFVEMNLKNLLLYGNYPAIYNSSHLKIQDCGCTFAPKKIKWGSEIGLECHRGLIPGARIPPLNVENCGSQCNDQHGFDVVLFCPKGWVSDCTRGCHPLDEFHSFEDRVNFWENTVDLFLLHGTEYINIKNDYLEECGCSTKARQIRYGTRVGFDCIMKEDGVMKPGCNAASSCMSRRGDRLVTFCPAGHTSTCSGCTKTVDGETLADRLDWMVRVSTDLAALSLPTLEWHPRLSQLLGCGCKGNAKQIEYGSQIGFRCSIHDPKLVTEECGPNKLCQDADGTEILHLCPRGYTPSCMSGCANPVLRKEEEKIEA